MKQGIRIWLLALGLAGSALGQEKQVIEPVLREAFEGALKRLPAALKAEIGDVKLKRATDMGVPPKFPLEVRLLNRAAYASFNIGKRELTVYDAGAKNQPLWSEDGPSQIEVAKLLAGVADVMGVKAPKDGEDPHFQPAWAEFVKRVYSWRGDKAPTSVPAVNDKEVWNRFLGDGVWRLLGGEVTMEQLMVHEFGHALQLDMKVQMAKMTFWSELSGVTESKNKEPADGYVGGMQQMENTMVLIRLLMTDTPGTMSRGEIADYQLSSKARLLNRYARYDLREDYAESFRMMTYNPARLAKEAPEKFLYLNALGWNARLDLKNSGPLWYSGEEFEKYLPKSKRKELFARLLGKEGNGPDLSPVPLAAILRAHAGELAAEDLPAPFPVVEIPGDLPKTMRKSLDSGLLNVEIDGVIHTASPARQRERQEELISRFIGDFDFAVGILKFRTKTTEGVEGGYLKDVMEARTPGRRFRNYEALREYGWASAPRAKWREWDRKEAKFHKENGNAWLAARYSILVSEKDPKELYAEIKETAAKGESGYERSLFIGTAVDLALKEKNPDLVDEKIREIPGEALGGWLRARYAILASKNLGEKSKARFRKIVSDEAEKSRYPEIKRALDRMLKEKD